MLILIALDSGGAYMYFDVKIHNFGNDPLNMVIIKHVSDNTIRIKPNISTARMHVRHYRKQFNLTFKLTCNLKSILFTDCRTIMSNSLLNLAYFIS